MCNVVLIVDDSSMIQLGLSKQFKLQGYTPVAVGNGKDALDFLMKNEVYAIVLDYELPDLDGLSVYKLLKKHPELRKIPVIIISAHDKLELIGQAYEEGIPLFLRKKDMIMTDVPQFVSTIAKMKKFALERENEQ